MLQIASELKPLTSGLLVQRSLKVTLVLVLIVSSFTPFKEMNVRDLFARVSKPWRLFVFLGTNFELVSVPIS